MFKHHVVLRKKPLPKKDAPSWASFVCDSVSKSFASLLYSTNHLFAVYQFLAFCKLIVNFLYNMYLCNSLHALESFSRSCLCCDEAANCAPIDCLPLREELRWRSLLELITFFAKCTEGSLEQKWICNAKKNEDAWNTDGLLRCQVSVLEAGKSTYTSTNMDHYPEIQYCDSRHMICFFLHMPTKIGMLIRCKRICKNSS